MRLILQFITIIVLGFVSALAQVPPPAAEKFKSVIGEYEFSEQKILIREAGGRLHALFNPPADGIDMEPVIDWPLSEISPGKYTYSFGGDFANFQFQFDQDGSGVSFLMRGDKYARKMIEPNDGNTFKVSPDKPIEEYIKVALEAEPPVQNGDFRDPDLVDITTILENVKLDVRYAGDNNFLSTPTYSLAKIFLHRPAVIALNEANKRFNELGFGLLVHDAYRPWYVTKIFWDATKGSERDFVANPASGSKHNMGSAIDLTLYDLESGEVIEMVGTYDEMTDRSYPDYPGGTDRQRWHRDLLRRIMEDVGFTVVYNEWWHFDYKDWEKYPILNQTFEELLAQR